MMICCSDLPAAELCQQASRDAPLHEDAAAFVFDPLDLPGFMEQRDQRTLLIRQLYLDRGIGFIKLLLDNIEQFTDANPLQCGNRDRLWETTDRFPGSLRVTQLIHLVQGCDRWNVFRAEFLESLLDRLELVQSIGM